MCCKSVYHFDCRWMHVDLLIRPPYERNDDVGYGELPLRENEDEI